MIIFVIYDGNKVKIDATPSTSLGEIKEMAVKKLKLSGAVSSFNLFGRDKKKVTLAMDTPLRLCGFAANATLELRRSLVANASNQKGTARIAITLEDVPRIVLNTVPVKSSLFQLLELAEREQRTTTQDFNLTHRVVNGNSNNNSSNNNKVDEDAIYLVPVVTIMQRKIDSLEKLFSTTLVDVGAAANGSLAIRVSFTPSNNSMTLEEAKKMIAEGVGAKRGDDGDVLTNPLKATTTTSTTTTTTTSTTTLKPTETETSTSNATTTTTVHHHHTTSTNNLTTTTVDAVGAMATSAIDRQAKLLIPSHTRLIDVIDVADEFFTLTTEDAKRLYELSKEEKVKEEAGRVLKTKAMREAEQEQSLKKYTHGVIRIRFSHDNTELEGRFNANERVGALYDFVRSSLSDDDAKRLFTLFIAPPKTLLQDKSKTLGAMRLMPLAVVYCNFSDGAKRIVRFQSSLERMEKEAPLADRSSSQYASHPTISSSSSSSSVSNNNNNTATFNIATSRSPHNASSPSSSTGPSKSKKPKWLKL